MSEIKYKKIIKKIDLADEWNKGISGNFGRTMEITMEDAFIFKQLLKHQLNDVEQSKNNYRIPHDMHCSIVKHPIDSNCKENKLVTYCFNCGTNVKGQKYCHRCGKKLIWNNT